MILDGNLQIAAEAGERWRDREKERTRHQGMSLVDIEPPRRILARLERLTSAAPTLPSRAMAFRPPLPEAQVLRDIGLDRAMGNSDFHRVAFVESGLAVARFVGRVSIRSAPDRTVGFGTGFMVSPRLLLTNNHVLPSPQSAQFSEVEFDYQQDRTGRPLPLVPFALEPQTFFMTDVGLDFTLVAVSEGSRQAAPAPLAHYGWSRLIGEEGKILVGEHVNIIQHPKGQRKQFVSRANELVDMLENYLHYVTDTEQGSSGSPVYNDQWEVVALHHSGVPRMEDGQYIAKDGRPWDGRDGDDIDWIANEGVRVSRIVRHIEGRSLDRVAGRLRDDLLNLEPPSPLIAAQMAEHDAKIAGGGSKAVSVMAPSEILGATSSTGDPRIVQAPGDGAPNSWTATIHFATDRHPAPHPRIGLSFGAQRARDLVYGECQVSIPTRRGLGELPTPKWWKLEFRADPKKHFFVKSATQMTVSAFVDSVRARLSAAASRELLIFVHGYNVSFESAALRTAQLALDLQFVGAPILFSWPSQGNPAGYAHDAATVANSSLIFANFLAQLATITGADQVHIIAHSMGNQVVCGALHQLSLRRGDDPQPLVSHLALAAPDVDRDFYRGIADRIRRISQTVTLYASSRDRAIQASRHYNGNPRAGEPLVVTPGVVTIDASGVDTDFLAHGYFSDDPALLGDLFDVLRGVPAMKRFRLRPRVSPDGKYYEFLT